MKFFESPKTLVPMLFTKELRPSKNLNCNLKIKSQKYHFLNKNVLHTDLKVLVELSDLIASHKDKQRMQKHKEMA